MNVTMLLADAVQAVGGKLYILGGGWSIIGPDPTPMAIAIKVEVPWEEANRVHTLQLSLLDEDGRPVLVPTLIGDHPVELGMEFEVGRPAGLRVGTPLDVPLAINLGPLPLHAGNRYVWNCSIDGHSEPNWRVSFSVRPSEQRA
jgi:uncharacterized protein DUF6941